MSLCRFEVFDGWIQNQRTRHRIWGWFDGLDEIQGREKDAGSESNSWEGSKATFGHGGQLPSPVVESCKREKIPGGLSQSTRGAGAGGGGGAARGVANELPRPHVATLYRLLRVVVWYRQGLVWRGTACGGVWDRRVWCGGRAAVMLNIRAVLLIWVVLHVRLLAYALLTWALVPSLLDAAC